MAITIHQTLCSGKTHSLLNLGEDGGGGEAGLVPRMAVDLFTRIAADWAGRCRLTPC